MYKIVSKLLMYGDMPKDSILMQLSDIFKQMDQDTQSRDELVTRIFTQVKHLLQVATDYGFDKNLWHNYLTYLLITDENPFSLTCEKVGANDGSVNFFAKGDFKAFKASGTSSKSSIRTIYKAEVFEMPNNRIYIELTGNGFLYNMVRIMSGTIIEVGLGKRDAESIRELFEVKDRSRAGFLAPANALFLAEVFYEQQI